MKNPTCVVGPKLGAMIVNSYIIIEGEEASQGSNAWLKFREGKVGASDAPSIIGINPWETKLECWERFVFGKKKKKTAAMQRGNDLESEARGIFCDLFSSQYLPIVVQSKEHPSLIASLDGWNGTEVLEIKCPNRETHLQAKRGVIPDYYQCQMQHQMMIMGCANAWYCSYDGEKVAIVPLARDEKFIKDLVSSEMAFIRSVIDLVPPEACDRDRVELVDSNAILMAERYKQLDRLIHELQTEQDLIRKDLIEEATHPRVSIGDLSLSKVVRAGAIDYASIPELKEVDLTKYRKKPVETWRITF